MNCYKLLKYLKYTLFIGFGLFIVYLMLWTFILFGLAWQINSNLSKSSHDIVLSENLRIHFNKVSVTGFPFKFALRIKGFEEITDTNVSSYVNDIIIGYDILRRGFFASYNGDIIAKSTPVALNFGSKISIQDGSSEIYVKIPFGINFIRTIKYNNSGFDFINLIKKIRIYYPKVEIFDLVDVKKLYQSDQAFIEIKASDMKGYNSIQDFIYKPPSNIQLDYKITVNQGLMIGKLVPSTLFYFISPNFSFDMRGVIKLDLPDINSINVNISDLNFISKYLAVKLNMLYTNRFSDVLSNKIFSIKTQIELKQGIFDECFIILQKFEALTSKVQFLEKAQQDASEHLKYIVKHQNQLSFKTLEGKNYDIDVNLSSTKGSNYSDIDIKDISISSGATQILTTGTIHLTSNLDSNAKGILFIKNYPKLVDFIMHNFYVLSPFKKWNQDTKDLYTITIKSFMREISDQQHTVLSDASWKYEFLDTDIQKCLIGSKKVEQLKNIFYSTLYREAIHLVPEGANPIDEVEKLLPHHNKNLIKKLLDPKQLDPKAWEQLIQ